MKETIEYAISWVMLAIVIGWIARAGLNKLFWEVDKRRRQL